jgi:DNA-directed RNA polymerase subunit M/transcription elongation factor TFIIS
MFCWKAEFRAGPPGCSDDECIHSGWFDSLERAKEDAIKNSGVQVFSYPFLRYSQYKLTFLKKEEGIERCLGEPQLFTFPFNSGSMLVYPRSIQVKAPTAVQPKQPETIDAKQPQVVSKPTSATVKSSKTKAPDTVNDSANTKAIPKTVQETHQRKEASKAALHQKLKRKVDLPLPKRGRPRGSKNKPKPVENKV